MQHGMAHRRRLMSGWTLLMFFAASVALLAIASVKPKEHPSTAPVAVLASVGLTDDDEGRGLFRVAGLVPDKPVSRCLTVTYAGSAPAGTVYVAASQISGPLAANLRITLEQGTGGSFASCAGFKGAVVFDGPLDSLADPDPAAPRTATGWSPAAGESRTYRVTATVQDVPSAQGRTSTAVFRWFLFGMPDPAPSPTADVPTQTPTQTPTGIPSAAPTVVASVVPTEVVADAPVPQAVAGATPGAVSTSHRPANTGMGAGRGRDGDGDDDGGATASSARKAAAKKAPIAKLREALAEFSRELTEVAVRSTTHSALPVTGAAILLAFLVLQNRLDRLDPKLALTRGDDPHLVFRDPREEESQTTQPARSGHAEEDAP
jgi:hypothetical protein